MQEFAGEVYLSLEAETVRLQQVYVVSHLLELRFAYEIPLIQHKMRTKIQPVEKLLAELTRESRSLKTQRIALEMTTSKNSIK